MLDSIWHLRGSVHVDGDSSDEGALDPLEHPLERQRKSVSERGVHHLAFNAPLWSDEILSKKLLVDLRNLYDRDDVERNGFRYIAVGR